MDIGAAADERHLERSFQPTQETFAADRSRHGFSDFLSPLSGTASNDLIGEVYIIANPKVQTVQIGSNLLRHSADIRNDEGHICGKGFLDYDRRILPPDRRNYDPVAVAHKTINVRGSVATGKQNGGAQRLDRRFQFRKELLDALARRAINVNDKIRSTRLGCRSSLDENIDALESGRLSEERKSPLLEFAALPYVVRQCRFRPAVQDV